MELICLLLCLDVLLNPRCLVSLFQIVVKFQPRDVGEYEQSWDLMASQLIIICVIL